MFVPPVCPETGTVLGPRVSYAFEVLRGMRDIVARYRFGATETAPPGVLDDLGAFVRAYATVEADADGNPFAAAMNDCRVELRCANESRVLLWMPANNVTALKIPDDCPPLGVYAVIFVLANTLDGRPRHTQQEHFLLKCPVQKFEVWNTDDVFLMPRVPVAPLAPNGQRYVRLSPTDPAARVFSGHAATETVLHGKFVSRRSV